MKTRHSARSAIAACVALASVGCVKLIDGTTYTPTTKDVMKPYVAAPDLELAEPASKLFDAPLPSTHCRARADGSFDFTPVMNGGTASSEHTGVYFYGEGGACIGRSLRDTWGAAMNQQLMVWDDVGNSGTYEELVPPAGVARLFDVEYTHLENGPVPTRVKWSMTWHHSILVGNARHPRRILINYRRYKGTKYIKYWEGSIILNRVADQVTGVWIRNQIKAAQITEVDARGGAADILRKLGYGVPFSGDGASGRQKF